MEVKVKFSLCLIKHYAIKTCKDSFLTSSLDGDKWSHSGLFAPEEGAFKYPLHRKLPNMAALATLEKNTIFAPHRESNIGLR
jgi:hypothetical protein